MSRNPLMRGSDRIEGYLRVIALIVAVAAIPFAAAAGTAGYSAAADRIRVENSTKVAVQATLLTDPVPTPTVGADQSAVVAHAPVRWVRNGADAQANVAVPQDTVRGNTIQVWLGPSGRPVPPPAPSDTAGFLGLGAAIAVLVVVWTSVAAVLGAAQWVLNRRNSAAWAHEWRLMALTLGRDNR